MMIIMRHDKSLYPLCRVQWTQCTVESPTQKILVPFQDILWHEHVQRQRHHLAGDGQSASVSVRFPAELSIRRRYPWALLTNIFSTISRHKTWMGLVRSILWIRTVLLLLNSLFMAHFPFNKILRRLSKWPKIFHRWNVDRGVPNPWLPIRRLAWLFLFAVLMVAGLLFCMVFFVSRISSLSLLLLWCTYHAADLNLFYNRS